MYHFILNPGSRSGIAEKIWLKTIEPYLTEHNIDFRIHYSQFTGDTTSLVKEITQESEGNERIIILGGDGTLNEALQGITDFTSVCLGLIPIGSSNDVCRDMPIPSDPIKALEKILSVEIPTPLDYGTVTFEDGSTQHFIVSMGIGFDAAVCEETNRSSLKGVLNKLHMGKLIYTGIALKQIFTARRISATLTLPGQEPRQIPKLLFLAAMNHKHEGGGFMFGPDADYTDGILNLCEVDDVSKMTILMALPAAYKGHQFRYRGVLPHKADHFTVETSEPMWVHVDGEVSRKADKIEVTCHQKGLLFLV